MFKYAIPPVIKANEKLFFFLCLGMIALLFLRDVGNVSITKWVFLLLAIIVFIVYDWNYTAVFISFLIPLIVGLPNTYIFFAGIIIFIGKNPMKIVINRELLILITIFIVELLSFIYGEFLLMDYVKFITPLLFISLIIFNNRVALDFKKMLYYFVFATVAVGVLIILQSISVSDLNGLFSSGVRLGDTNELLVVEGIRVASNPNELGLLCAVSISILLVLLEKTSNRAIIILTTAFLLFVGLATQSRSFLVLLAIIVCFYCFAQAKSCGSFLKIIISTLFVLFTMYLAIGFYSPTLQKNITSRFSEHDVMGGRVELLELYFESMAQHPEHLFLGVGLQNYPQKSGVYDSSHNGFQEILIIWGVIGFILVARYIFGIYKCGIRGTTKKNLALYSLPLLIMLIGVQSGQFFSSNATLYFLPIYASLRMNIEDKNFISEKGGI